MKKVEIVKNAARVFNKTGLKIRKASPEILVVAGVVGVVASAVMACRATTKVNKVLDETKETIDAIHEATEKKVTKANEDYTPEDAKNDLRITYLHTGLKFVRLYGPSVLLGTVSIASILGSHHILYKRNRGLAAAYTGLLTGYKEYRSRVIERFGEAVDKELKYNIKAQKFEEISVDSETGKETKAKITVNVADPNTYSEYARFYDDGCKCWEKDPEYNLVFLKAQQQYANDKLHADGYLFLNDVYDMLGIPRTKAGQVVGWIYDEKNPVGDNFVDFGIYDINRPSNRDFVNGYERTILLDFNVDGSILDLI
ncbi:MAG: DUF6353 family protein [Eubacteriales bacterium]|nr:DUF6353 family protein [Eubacteriales bacterium]